MRINNKSQKILTYLKWSGFNKEFIMKAIKIQLLLIKETIIDTLSNKVDLTENLQ